jgi:hypothetical protein
MADMTIKVRLDTSKFLEDLEEVQEKVSQYDEDRLRFLIRQEVRKELDRVLRQMRLMIGIRGDA